MVFSAHPGRGDSNEKSEYGGVVRGYFILGPDGAVAGAARYGGTFNFCAPYGGDIFTLDPHRSPHAQDFLVGQNIHRCLYTWNADKSQPALALADKVETSNDGLVYKFYLKRNIQGCVLCITLVFLLVNLAVDLLYALIDPRIEYQ